MNHLLQKTKDAIFAQQTSIFASTLILAGMTILSSMAGFMRYRILATYFTKEELDIFFAAFRIPDLMFEILIIGAISTAFIPFFIEYQNRKEKQGEIISSIINAVTLVLGIGMVAFVVFLPLLAPLIAPGFDAEQTTKLILYSRILVLGQLPFLVLGNFLTGISQAKRAFLIPALAPIVYNISIIVVTVVLKDSLSMLAPITGVVVGAVLFLLIQLPILKIAEFKYELVLTQSKEIYRFFRAAVPRILTIAVAQIDTTIDLTLCTLLGPGSYTVFYLAQRLQLLPVSVIGMSFGQASLPYLTDLYQSKKHEELKKIITNSMLSIFFFTIPAAAFFMITRTPTVRIFFGGEKFDWEATVMTATTLTYFSLSLPFHAVYYFLARCFYAVFDTKTPFYVSAVTIILSASLSVLFVIVFELPVWSLALAFSITMTVRSVILYVLLSRKIPGLDMKELVSGTIKILLVAFNSAIPTYFLMRVLDGLIIDTSRTLNVFGLLAIGFMVYSSLFLLLSWLFGIKEIYIITKMLMKVKNYGKQTTEVYKGVEGVEG
ncbi:MAG: murein biosynthesis integral membrane protein MurJ [bacterium]|nr:murein biosynthesis integral membrane protein MurJ [bacterium]